MVCRNTYHFLLECDLFQNLRQKIITTVSEIAALTLKSLLFGNPDLRNEANEPIFLAVRSFISKAKRFQTDAVVKWLERLAYGAESRRKVVPSRLGFVMRRLENSVSSIVSGYLLSN